MTKGKRRTSEQVRDGLLAHGQWWMLPGGRGRARLWLLSRKDGIDQKRAEWSLVRGNRNPEQNTRETLTALNVFKLAGLTEWHPRVPKPRLTKNITNHNPQSSRNHREAERCWKAGDSGVTSKDAKQINAKKRQIGGLGNDFRQKPSNEIQRGVLCVLRRTKCGHQGALEDKGRSHQIVLSSCQGH